MKLMLQIAVVMGVCLAGEAISVFLPFAFPGSVIALILLFLLLLSGILKPDHIREKSRFLQENMAFFFIPAGVGILGQFEQIKGSIFPLILICIITTVLTFGAAALTVRGVMALQEKAGKRDGQ